MRYSDNFEYTPVVKLDTDNKRRYYKTILYSDIPKDDSDIYVVTVIGDRLDLLAAKYYNRAELWWLIASCNTHVPKGTVFLEPNTQIRIPRDFSDILVATRKLNQTL